MYKRLKNFGRKKFKKVKEKGLPSFLLDLEITNESKALLKKNDPDVYLGPIFFGCKQYHPPFYSLNLSDSHQSHYTSTYKENILKGVFRSKPMVERHEEVKKSFHPIIKRRKLFTDLYPHKCPGNKKVFKPLVAPRTIDLGETKSIIEGETSREIPLCWLKKVSPGTLKTEFEIVTPSDIWERKRAFLPYKKRIAHTHFSKEFVTAQVIGPTIPAALIITKICSKREYVVDIYDQVQPETKKTGKKITKEKTEKKVENVVTEEAELSSPERILQSEEEYKEEVKSIEASIFEEDEQSEQSEQCLSEIEEIMSVEKENEEKEGSVIFSEEGEQDEENLENEESEIEN